eukprot:c26347_g1_i1 orf=296-2095(-)
MESPTISNSGSDDADIPRQVLSFSRQANYGVDSSSDVMENLESGTVDQAVDGRKQGRDVSRQTWQNGQRELVSVPATPVEEAPSFTSGNHTPITSKQYRHSYTPSAPKTTPPTPTRTPTERPTPSLLSPRSIITPLGSPMRRVLINMKNYLEEIGHLTTFKEQDAWLPITESRTGNSFYSAFHNLNAGIGYQGLLLPVAFTYLGWTWGILALVAAYIWQLYTMWLLIRLHEGVPGKRSNRYMELAQLAFGEKLGYGLAIFPLINLTAGFASGLVVIGGSSLKLFYKTVCGRTCGASALSTTEWYLVFTLLSAVLAQLPNMNSIAGVSLVGAVTAMAYYTFVWALSVSYPRPPGVSFHTIKESSNAATVFSILNALGIVAFAFRGHNLAPEIQATIPSTIKHPSHTPMWRGAKVANMLIVSCYFPLAIGGFWAYGNKVLASGMLNTLYAFHQSDIPRTYLAITFLLVVWNSLGSFQIYSMPMFDMIEAGYTKKRNKPCSFPVRMAIRISFVFLSFLISVAFPFISDLAGLLGGISSIPVTFAFPCFMWLCIKKPKRYTFFWYLNWVLGVVGAILGFAFSAGGLWSLVDSGLKLRFFKPQG